PNSVGWVQSYPKKAKQAPEALPRPVVKRPCAWSGGPGDSSMGADAFRDEPIIVADDVDVPRPRLAAEAGSLTMRSTIPGNGACVLTSLNPPLWPFSPRGHTCASSSES